MVRDHETGRSKHQERPEGGPSESRLEAPIAVVQPGCSVRKPEFALSQGHWSRLTVPRRLSCRVLEVVWSYEAVERLWVNACWLDDLRLKTLRYQ
jgi:hypothetical protein